MTDTGMRDAVAPVLRGGRPSTWAYRDVSADRDDPRGWAESTATATIDELVARGAPEADAEAIADELIEPPGVAAPVSRYVLVQDGEVVVSEVLPGPAKASDRIGHGLVPDVLPLVAHRPLDLTFLVVEVGRDGGGFRVYRFGHGEVQSEQQLQGRTDTLHKIRGGGWAHKRMQSHTEELWRQNVGELGAAIDATVRRTSAGLVVVAGDIRARQLLELELSEETRAMLSVVPSDTRAPDAADDALVSQVEVALARIVAQRVHDSLDLLRARLGRGDGTAVDRLGEVVTALASAQVDTLLLDPDAFDDRTLLALGDVPWVASAPEGALDAEVLGELPAASALARAALLTDARVVLASAGSLPGDGGIGALLRWPVGPPTPGGGGGGGGDAG
ncbi:hypothetical protein ASF17_09665 [Frigoribacterium sp. Leaf263]|uniref:baeRF2 domain-containing protein n=1 Tax=Frigoribacterium sp. Leaf263 TaxID=1736313 RepID=UPI0006F3E1A2|nr:Vms1/Ankzf1 family peptidyl-tRNA hydrolase [Frigoribacterium sp. Leaf263]KQO81449.1 hypothetical protein ASF17_09665 [Frigoribacterium sp. Leaf263]